MQRKVEKVEHEVLNRGPEISTCHVFFHLLEFEYTYSTFQKVSEKNSRASNAHQNKQKGRNKNICKYRRISTFRNYKIFIREIDITCLEILNAGCGCLCKIKSLWSQIIKKWNLSRNLFYLKYRNECYTLNIRYIFAFYIKYSQISLKCIKIRSLLMIFQGLIYYYY